MTCFRWRILILPQSAYPLGDRSAIWEQERREILESVIGELERPDLDAAGRAVCADLLKHIAGN